MASGEYDDYLPSYSNPDESLELESGYDEGYEEKLEYIRRYLLAGRENFNLINFYIVQSNERDVDNDGDGSPDGTYIENDLSGVTNSNFESSSIFNNQGENTLFYPESDKYNIDITEDRDTTLDTYLDLTSQYLQHWAVPFSIAIASYDYEFGIDVLQYAKSRVDTKLFEIQKHTRIKTIVISDSGTNTSYGSVSSVDYRFIPKITYAETLYSILDASYYVKVPDFDNDTPYSSVEYYRETNEYTGKTTIKIRETWYDDVVTSSYNTYTYKLSYLNDDESSVNYEYDGSGNYENGNPITRIDWFMDSGKGDYESFPSKDSQETLDWYNKLYSDDAFYAYSGEAYYFDTNEQLKDFLEYKYQSLSNEEEEELESNEYITIGDGSETKQVVAPDIITPYSFTELYLAYDQIDSYYEDLEVNSDTYFSNSVLDLTGLPSEAFAWPCDVDLAEVTSYFGPRDLTGSFHYGIDIASYGGTNIPVYAAHDGTVIKVYNTSIESYKVNGEWVFQGGYGTYVVLKTDDGQFTTYYAHMLYNSVLVSEGDTVVKGQQLGLMGTTGSSTGVHLHFEVRNAEGTQINPELFFNIENNKYVSSVFEDTSSGLSTEGISFITGSEGTTMVDGMYVCFIEEGTTTGTPTIGYGITYNATWFAGTGITELIPGVTTITAETLASIEEKVYGSFTSALDTQLENYDIQLKQYEYDAVISFLYQSGSGWADDFATIYLKIETIKSEYNITDDAVVASLWLKYFFGNSITGADGDKTMLMTGLPRRRNKETLLYVFGDYDQGGSNSDLQNYNLKIGYADDLFDEKYADLELRGMFDFTTINAAGDSYDSSSWNNIWSNYKIISPFTNAIRTLS